MVHCAGGLVIAQRSSVSRYVHYGSRWTLCGILAVSAAAKLLTPYQEAYFVPEALYYLGALVELGAAAALHLKYRRHAIAATLVLALGGICLGIAVPGELCGCFGSLLRLEGRYHVLVSGALGALACLSAMTDAGPGSPRAPESLADAT